MEGANVLHLSCGYAHVCFVVEPTNDAYKETLASLPRLENTQSSVEAGASAPEGKKRAAKEEGEAGAKKKTTKK